VKCNSGNNIFLHTHLDAFMANRRQCGTGLEGPSGCNPTNFLDRSFVTFLKHQMTVYNILHRVYSVNFAFKHFLSLQIKVLMPIDEPMGNNIQKLTLNVISKERSWPFVMLQIIQKVLSALQQCY